MKTEELAQTLNFNGGGSVQGPLPGNPQTLGQLFNLNNNNLLNIIIFLAGGVLLMYIIYGGYKYLTAQGDPKAMDGARNTITYALIGFAIVAFSYFVFQIVELFFGIKILGLLVPIAYAAPVDIGSNLLLDGGGSVGSKFGTFGDLFSRVLTFAITLAGVIFVIMLVIGGLKWVSSQGDKSAVESARGTITTAIIGLVIVVSSYIVLQIIQALTGFKVISSF